jgi:NitT/TauT family transport system substrate-binding protein
MRRIAVLVLAVLLVAGCSEGRGPEAKKASLRPFEVTLDWVPSPEYCGFYYALWAGLYARSGLDVRLRNGTGAPSVAADLGAGAIYAGTTTSDNLVRQIARGARFSRAVVLLAYNPVVIASIEGSGIIAPRDLEGRVLGTNRDSSTYQQLLFLQDRGHVDLAKVREYPIQYGGAAALLEHRADAVLAYRANVMMGLEAKGQRAQEILLSGYGIYSYVEVLAFAESAALASAKVRTSDVDAFVDATQEGYKRCAQDITGCVKLLTENDPTLDPAQFLLGIRAIRRLTAMAAYPRSELDQWAVRGKVTEAHRKAALALYREPPR